VRVLVAGATGALGTPLTRKLLAAGHEVIGISRTPGKRDKLRALGAESLVVDVMDKTALLNAVDGLEADAVIHQLTAMKNASPRLRADDPTNALRTRGTANLLAAARMIGARRLVTQSLIFGYGYGDHGARELTEDDPFGLPQGIYTDPLVAGLLSAEQQTFTAERIEGIALRYGLLYGPGAFSDLFVELMRRRQLAIPRGGGGTISWIHVEDAAAATVAALELGQAGRAYNVVDDEPVNWQDFTWTLAEAFGTPRPLAVPRWALRLVAPYLAFMMTSTLRVSNAKAKRELLWTPATPTYHEGLSRLAQALGRRGQRSDTKRWWRSTKEQIRIYLTPEDHDRGVAGHITVLDMGDASRTGSGVI
jgi:nucleoside-diphosphate-sugar epimerase